MKKKILVLSSCYLPSIKGGGPVQSLKNLVDNLSDELEFNILTANRDWKEENEYPNIKSDEWVEVGNARVFYTNPDKLTLKKLVNIINNSNPDIIYLNSYFSFKFSIAVVLLKKMNKLNTNSVVIAPRGEFSKGALAIKSLKKKVFLNATKILGLYRGLTWHATSETEEIDIREQWGKNAQIKIAGNLTSDYSTLNYDKKIEKESGNLKIVFVSRVVPKKNLKQAIKLLKYLNGSVEFDIYGPLEDRNYWSECKRMIEELPENIKVSYKGILNHTEVLSTFRNYHVFLFPTLGENFGHVISEALIGGCPVIISDQTPWRGLEENKVGWDIELNNEEKFISSLQSCIDLDCNDYRVISNNAFEYGKEKSNIQKEVLKTYNLFQ